MILFIGVAGAGKSVQGQYLSDLMGFPWISTGELLRMHISGEKRHRMLEGELLTDEELYEVVEPVLKSALKGEVILDGFPRTEPQAEWLYDYAKKNNAPISCVIHIDADEDVVIDRLIKRGRPDDTKDAIQKRFSEYRKVTLPILEYFEDLGIPCPIVDGNGTEEEVQEKIKELVQKVGIKRHEAKNNN